MALSRDMHSPTWHSSLLRLAAATIAILVIASCKHQSDQPPAAVTFQIDESLRPVPAAVGGEFGERPLALLQNESGEKTLFVENELVVRAETSAAMETFASRWAGEVLAREDLPKESGGSGTVYLVRVDPGNADPAQLPDLVGQYAHGGAGRYRVSSDAALRLLTAAYEPWPGVVVNLNIVGHPTGFAEDLVSRVSLEAPVGPDPAWNSNAFTWPYMRKGGAQDIGVGEAWRRLVLAGRIGPDPRPLVPVAVLDAGFVDSRDLPRRRLLNARFDATGRTPANAWGCSTGAGCVYHGTAVSHVLAGLPDNRRGIAGPAGPVADLLLVQSPEREILTWFGYVGQLLRAIHERPKIINISAGWTVDGILAPVIGIVGLLTDAVRRGGTLIFASADNLGQDIDRDQCVAGICWETQLQAPCELAGVICVGGLGRDSNRHHPNSNFSQPGGGHDGQGVDIFGPYVVYTPAGDRVDVVMEDTGTSYSSPFVAGVAALIWAANPAFSADQVEQTLMQTAHVGSPDPAVTRWVNADAAVARALGGNCEPPALRVIWPTTGTSVTAGSTVTLRVDARDAGGRALPDAQIRWFVDGAPVGTGASVAYTAERTGEHRVRVEARTCAAVPARAEVRLTVLGPGSLAIVQPRPGATIQPQARERDGRWYADVAMLGAGTLADGGPVPGDRLRWTSSVDGVLGTGTSISARLHSTLCYSVPHQITLELLDDDGVVVVRTSVSITVAAAPC